MGVEAEGIETVSGIANDADHAASASGKAASGVHDIADSMSLSQARSDTANDLQQTDAQDKRKQLLCRWAIYLIGLLVLALGISMNTKSGLGVSPIISVSFSISTVWELNFGDVTFGLYAGYVLVEMILHAIKRRGDLKRIFVMDLLQLPLSLVFTRFLNVFSVILPELAVDYAGTFWGSIPGRIIFLIIAIILTGIGAALSLNMRLIPNPGDGIVQALADFFGSTVGLAKNCFDLFNVCLTSCIGLLLAGHIVGIGLGTLMAMIGVGRVIAVVNHFFMEKMLRASGLPMRGKAVK